MRTHWLASAIVALGVSTAGCATGGSSGPDGPARAMARLKEPVRLAAEGYIGVEEQLARVLSGVTDSPGAREAMPRIEELLGRLGEHWRVLDGAGASARAEARYAFWRQLESANTALDSQVSRIKGTPGVGSALGPLLEKVPRWR